MDPRKLLCSLLFAQLLLLGGPVLETSIFICISRVWREVAGLELNSNPPRMMKKCLFVMMSIGVIAGGAMAQEAGAKIEGAAADAAGADAVISKDVAKLLDEQLIVADGEGVKAAKLEKGMEYYLIYHSASW